jgi:quercetin 2,3-dioxygenase
MPAVTVDDMTKLPRLLEVSNDAVVRPVTKVVTAPFGFEGEGFPVRRAFAGVSMRDLDPFIHLDQMGEVEYAPGEPKGTPWHPHRGFETVTYMIDGTFQHRDSHGGGGLITNGATQWMTAGSGILHIEVPPEELIASGGLFHGVQLWVNLPSNAKMTGPAYQSLEPETVALASAGSGGSLVRVIAGDIAGVRGPGSTRTPIAFAHVTVRPGEKVTIPWRKDFNALVYALSGSGSVGSDDASLEMGQLAIHGAGDAITITADQGQESRLGGMDVLVLGGAPINEPVVAWGPFVMNTRAEIEQAFDDFKRGAFGQMPD